MNAKRLFGTDGIRGTANQEPMTAEMALKVAMAAGRHFVPYTDRRSLAVIGKDTRLSGYMLEPAMVAGFTSIGMDVVLVGPMPTPAVAMLTRSLRADLGVMLSASHNPHHDNGIKLFGPDGFKLSDGVEIEIENRIRGIDPPQRAPAEKLGRARRLEDARGRYIEAVKASFPRGLRLSGLRIVVDCAHGAAYRVAPTVLYELGAEVISMSVDPDGFNINDGCGAVHPQALCERVRAEGADLGIALDGDADRLIMVDETGAVIDGDQILAVIAQFLASEDRLRGDTVVATVMSNLGLEHCLGERGIKLHRTAVGDRYVLEAMRDGGFNLGGEQSGHVILSDHGSTGDGIVAALQVLAAVIRSQRPMSEIARQFEPFPQILRNVKYWGSPSLDDPAVCEAIQNAETMLGSRGRLLIRPSGTEPLLRVMAEGEDDVLVRSAVNGVAEKIEELAG